MDQRPKTGRKDSRKMEFSGWKGAISIYFLVTLLLFLGSANGKRCSPQVSGSCGESVLLPCDFDPNFEGVYWFDESDEIEPLIRLENGYKSGRGYESHEYDVTQYGSLVIKNTQFTNDQQYKVILIDSEFRDETLMVDLTVTENCRSRVTGRLNTEGVISCCFNPDNEGVYWFEEHDDIEPLIRSENGITFGRGYDSHEHDMLLNGSLVIKKVRHTHEQIYKVILLDTEFREKTIFVDFSVTGNLCSPHVSGSCGESVSLPCDIDPSFEGVYWFDESDDEEPLIRLERGYKFGRGYKSHEYDVLQNGSLVIKNTQFTNKQQYKVILLDSEFRDETFTVDFSVTESCPSRVTGRLNTEGVISCCFNPENEGVYWFEEHDDIEPLIRSESGIKFGRGYDSHEHDMLLNGSLVIKNVQHTHEQIYKVILLDTEFREKTIFVDFSVTETLCTNLPSPNHGTVYQTAMLAEYNCEEGFHLNNNALVKCILNEATDTYNWSGPIPKCVRDIVTTTTVSTTTVATTPKTTTTKIYSSTTGSTTTNTPRPTLNDKNVHRNTIGSNTDKVHPTTKRGGSNSSHFRVHLAVITLAAITFLLCLIIIVRYKA